MKNIENWDIFRSTWMSEESMAIIDDSSNDIWESNCGGNLPTDISSRDTSEYNAGMSSFRIDSFSFWCSVSGRRFLLAGEILTKSEEFSSSKLKRLFDGVFLAELGFGLGRANFGDDAISAVFEISGFARSRKLLRNEIGVKIGVGESWRRFKKVLFKK